MYNSVNTAYAGPSVSGFCAGVPCTDQYENKDWWSGIFRVQRNFYP
jgi:hypothetical protein